MDNTIWFYLLNFIIGIGFGFFHRGKEDFMGILRNIQKEDTMGFVEILTLIFSTLLGGYDT